ncbi:helix-turn-helix domain-containing protein [Streptomyces sp. NPDC085932]|uniref:helix-turn-helix domain-containing protein n=1 Tax=Streptomyces sp. NPDC085932 TaxID=3365741 RepID=UPI0037D6DE55
MSTTRPLLTQREAAAAGGVSRTTIRRRREAGELPGAVLDDDRGWLIPVEDLLAAGFRLNAPAPPDEKKGVGDPAPTGTHQDAAPSETASALRAELERLRHEHAPALANERNARQLAEAETRHLTERLNERAAHIEDLQRALAALTPGSRPSGHPAPRAPVPGARPIRAGLRAGRGSRARFRLGQAPPLVAPPGLTTRVATTAVTTPPATPPTTLA